MRYKIYSFFTKNKRIKYTIDIEDKARTSVYTWTSDSMGYAVGRINGKLIRLHQFILGKKNGFVIDHINRNKSDNQKSNLRYLTVSENIFNNKTRGYSWDKNRKSWIVSIKINRKSYPLGRFKDERDAKKARINGENLYRPGIKTRV